MRKPNFFIVGFPKSGTTSLRRLLNQHPDIFVSKPEEPHYFCKDLHKKSDVFYGEKKRFRYRKEKDYLRLFSKAKKEKKLGESSVFYLYSKVAAKEIKKFNPESKIIIMLRNPVEFLNSMHKHNTLYRIDNALSLQKALRIEEQRKKDKNKIPKVVMFPSRLFYSDLAKFSEQINRYLEVFPKKQVKIVLLDDLKKSPEKTYKEVLDFLDVDKYFHPDFKRYNVFSVPRSKIMQKLIYDPSPLKEFIKKIVPFKIYDGLYTFIANLNKKSSKRPDLDVEFKKKLMKQYKPEVKKLSKLTGKDLISLWGYNKI